MLTMLCCTAAVVASVHAIAVADPRDQFEMRVYRDSAGGSLPYRLLTPKDYDAGKRYPVVLFLHGAGERGDDNRAQLVHGMKDFASEEIRDKYPCFVVAPQCPVNAQWVDTPWSADAHTMPPKPTAPMRMSLELLSALEQEFSIDPHRIYVTGLSMGGFGAWDAIQRQPQRFAAAVPLCGGGDTGLAKVVANIPIWAFHGADDTAVKTQRSRDMLAAIRAAGGSPRYTEYPHTGHDCWTPTYRNPEMYAWLFAQALK